MIQQRYGTTTSSRRRQVLLMIQQRYGTTTSSRRSRCREKQAAAAAAAEGDEEVPLTTQQKLPQDYSYLKKTLQKQAERGAKTGMALSRHYTSSSKNSFPPIKASAGKVVRHVTIQKLPPTCMCSETYDVNIPKAILLPHQLTNVVLLLPPACLSLPGISHVAVVCPHDQLGAAAAATLSMSSSRGHLLHTPYTP
jgi:hypothetical protein